jgi:hypothetical protein
MTVHRKEFLYNETNRRTSFQIYSGTKLCMFRTVSVPIIRGFPLYIRHWRMLYRFDDSLRAGSGCSILKLHASCRKTCITPMPVPNVQWKTPDDGHRNCPKHVEFRTRINLEISASVGFIVKKVLYIVIRVHYVEDFSAASLSLCHLIISV